MQTSAVALRLDPWPRELDAQLRFRLRYEPMGVGALLLFIVHLLLVFFIVHADMTDHRDDVVVGEGDVVSIEQRGRNRPPAVSARFGEQTVTSWFTDRDLVPTVGARVRILGDGNPAHLVLQGGRLRPDPVRPSLIVSMGAILLYLVCFIIHLFTTQRHMNLLRSGKEGMARYVREIPRRKDTSALAYEFFDGHRTRELVNSRPGQHDRDELEPVLFDHRSALFLDALPGHLRIEAGRFVAREPASRLAGGLAIAVVPLVLALVAAALWDGEVRSVADLVRVLRAP